MPRVRALSPELDWQPLQNWASTAEQAGRVVTFGLGERMGEQRTPQKAVTSGLLMGDEDLQVLSRGPRARAAVTVARRRRPGPRWSVAGVAGAMAVVIRGARRHSASVSLRWARTTGSQRGRLTGGAPLRAAAWTSRSIQRSRRSGRAGGEPGAVLWLMFLAARCARSGSTRVC